MCIPFLIDIPFHVFEELCIEAVLIALRREYPQIYLSNDKYQLDVNAVRIQRIDFVDSNNCPNQSSRYAAVYVFLFVIHFFKDMRIVSRPLSQRTRSLLISLIENIMKGLSLFKNTNV